MFGKKYKIKKFINKVNKNFDNCVQNNFKIDLFTTELKKFNLYSLEEKFAYIKYIIYKETNKKLYDSQIETSYYLYHNYAVDMKTGEGKSLSSIIPLVLKTLENNLPSYYLSINEYLLERDKQEFKSIFEKFNIYTTNNYDEATKLLLENKNFIIYTTGEILLSIYLVYYSKLNSFKIDENSFFLIDEADSVLIDSALRPIVLTSELETNKELFIKIIEKSNGLKKDIDYIIEYESDSCFLTDNGISKLENLYEIDNLYNNNNYYIIKLTQNYLMVKHFFIKNKNYIVDNEQLYYINEKLGTKTLLSSSDNTKQFLEVIENLKISNEKIPFQKITFQSFFKKIKNKSAMSGTIKIEEEFFNFYGMKVILIEENFKKKLNSEISLTFMNKREKLKFLIKKIVDISKKSQPILVGTTNINDSEIIFKCLQKVLINKKIFIINAKNNYEEAEIIKKSGEKDTITIVTQIAGRGVDILINNEINELGGLYVIMFEQNLNRRMDEQITGRTARQGNNGHILFLHSLEDDLVKKHFSKSIKNILYTLDIEESEVIKNKFINNFFKKSQKKYEQQEFLSFVNISKFDNVLETQRKIVFNMIENIYNTNTNDIIFNILKNITLNLKNNEEKCDFYEKNYNLQLQFNEILKEDVNKIVTQVIIENINEKNLKKVVLQFLLLEWQKFLSDCEDLSNGIFWRSKVNKDPLIEYQNESYMLFNEFIKNVRENIIKNIFNYLKNKHKE